ncbi:hypothetical protein U0030_15960 [Brevundimonas bullata]|uniref:hypothetical protein n=1 Tax=Brevundimonas bullata TaxID=13160 RepID=UPI000E0BE046|nr:hypothetical protein [Brevundimonas bullata]WQE36733.1 hypothetical protein U0030_15960 [Brevundimonas bullata]
MGGWPDDFFATTPRLYALVAEGRARAEQRRFRLTGWHAHTAASLERAKKIPALTKLIDGGDITRAATIKRTPDEMLSIARRWSVALAKGPGREG